MENTENENEQHGLACRRCGCRHLLAYRTVRRNNRIDRYRKCRYCGKTCVTSERVTG